MFLHIKLSDEKLSDICIMQYIGPLCDNQVLSVQEQHAH